MAVKAQTTVTIGTATTTTIYNPLYTFYGYNYTQQIYMAAEITAGGVSAGQQITAVRFYWDGTGNLTNTNVWTLYLGNTAQSTFASTTNWIALASLTQVFSGTVNLPAAAGWVTLTLTTPYIWTGGNLVVAVDENVPNYGSTANWRCTSTSANYRSIYYYSDGTNPDPAAPPTGTITYSRPNIQLDFISLIPCSGTPVPGTATISSNTGCVGASFSLGATGVSVGSGISYQWQSSSSASGPWTNVIGATSPNYVTSVTTNTFYQLITTCANSASSNTSNIVSYTVTGNACQCGTYPANYSSTTADEEITNATVGTMNNNSTCATLAPGPGSILNRYSNYTGFVTGPSVQNGEVVSFSLTQTSCGGSYGNGFQIYIDWTQDGDFLDAGEQVYTQPVAATGNHTKTGTFTVPVAAISGITRMRIVNVETTFPTASNYANTTTFSYGETEDYCITIVPASVCSGTPNAGTAVISTTTGCSGSSFNLTASNVTIGTGITYQWQSSTSASGPWTNITGANSPSYTTSVSSNTYYMMVTNCTVSGQLNNTNVVSYTVTGNACQCGTYPANYSSTTADEEITNATVGTMNNNSTCATLAPGPGSILNIYSNYTGFVAGPTVQLGEVVNFSLTQTSCGGSYGNGFQIYVDWNQDGDFLDAGEQVYTQPVAATGNHTKTGSFTVPAAATQGISRMRIVNVETTFPTANNYANTTTFSYGETEDYCITVIASTPCTGTPLAGTATPATQQVPIGSSASLSLIGFSAVSGLTFQWQQSASAAGPFVNVTGGTGATTSNYTTAALSVITYYQCIVTCTASGGSATSVVASVDVVATINMQNTTLNTCGSLFYDSGGASGNYLASENYTLIVYPSVPGSFVQVSFSSYVTESSYENLNIYNGNSTAAPLVGTYTGTASIPTYTSTAANGALTFNFTSDGSVQYAGWVASLTCYNPCVYFTPAFAAVGPYCAGVTIPALPTTSTDGVTGVWSPAINNLATTTYTFTPDAGQCALTASMTITINPNVPAIFSPVGSYCEGTVIPALPVTSTDGITGTWSPAINNLATTTYTFTANGGQCAGTNLTVVIDTVPSGITNNSGTTELNCSTAYISLTATGGVTYSWTGGTATVLASTVVSAPGTYTVTVNGANGCSTTESVIITQNITPPTAGITNNTGTTEFICSVAQISLTATGGVSYQWSGGDSPLTDINTFNTAGTYTVTVTAANGCTATDNITLTQSAPLSIVETITDALCFGLTGSANINIVSGGNAPYSISWDDGSILFTDSNIPANTTFGYTITDADLCTTTGDVFVNDPDLLTLSLTGTDISCYNASDGIAEVNIVNGGTLPYSYLWNNALTTSLINGLIPGNYILTVSDANNCQANSSVILTQPTEIVVSTTSTDAVCGGDGGTITTTVVGGTPGYTYNWSATGYGNSQIDLAPGTYVLTVSDANSCSVIESVVINKTGNINAGVSITQQITCSGLPDGILLAGSMDGVQPFTYIWSNSSTNQVISNLGAGTYDLTLTDDWGCVGNASATLTLPDYVVLVNSVTNVSCFGKNDGKIYVGISGGAPPYTINWNPTNSGNSISSLAPGQYSITVSDTRDCAVEQTFTVTEPEEVILNFTTNDVSCHGMNDGEIFIEATGGFEPYEFLVSNANYEVTGNLQNSVPTGNYTITVKDNNNCYVTDYVFINEPAQIEASVIAIGPSCIGNDDGYIEIIVVGGTQPYSYSFENIVVANPLIGDLRDGEYAISVVDNSNCTVDLGKVRINEFDVDCINIPNAISINGDGVNETWIIKNIEIYPGSFIGVFNRWGQEVYIGTTDSDPWDGKSNGSFVATGTYLYVVNLNNGTKPYTGTVTVVR